LVSVSAYKGAGTSLELRGVTKSFRGHGQSVLALHELSLTARPGEFAALIGPSGCGKSTAFNIVAGLDEPTGGEVLIGGEQRRDRLGASAYMPQSDTLLPWRRVLDNTTIALELAGLSRKEARRRALPLLERFGLGAFAKAWPWQLSGGMRHRAAFLRTVITEPTLMLLDEPFGALDGITRGDLQGWLTTVWEEYHSTVLLVTHDVAEAVFLADRVYVMTPRPGRIAAVVDIDLPRPRQLTLQATEEFASLERRLRSELYRAMGSAAGVLGVAHAEADADAGSAQARSRSV
jgi:ABC-type nitrate/sulfonate/bicarbonate transport system ATPase subunit